MTFYKTSIDVIEFRRFIIENHIKRLATFVNWKNISIKPWILAQAGFKQYNAASAICDDCNLLLFDFRSDIDPMNEHPKLKPKCTYVRLMKDRDDLLPKKEDIIFYWIQNNDIVRKFLGKVALDKITNILDERLSQANRVFFTYEEMQREILKVDKMPKTNISYEILCRICCKNKIYYIHIDCGHLVFCLSCWNQLNPNQCLLCGEKIIGTHIINWC